ncbi:MAG: hypothetical protein L0Z62_36690, partial [Gemmataceae bacterium]|nr:hypothetical protein [Gemmataceae bacterium]
MPAPAFLTLDSLPGYRILDCHTRSVVGEVWKAQAPDGHMRAVLIIARFANQEPITMREVRAAERLKTVRHRSLTMVEAVESDQGRLVMVMDWADQTLWDRFEQCRGQGLPGIPRPELLAQLRTAAETLDYMYQFQAIQHLGLNPHVIWMLDSRIILAECGLKQYVWLPANQSLVQSNPRYAAPELHERRPTRFTDQYSLALLGYELLTGQFPFRGTTHQPSPARLQGKPDLSAAPEEDRPVFARALDVDPGQRF